MTYTEYKYILSKISKVEKANNAMGLERVKLFYIKGRTIGLWKRNHPDLPYVIKINNVICAESDYIGDANRLYNEIIRAA